MNTITFTFMSSQNNIRECNVKFDDNSSVEDIINIVTSDVDSLIENKVMKKNSIISLSCKIKVNDSYSTAVNTISEDIGFEQAVKNIAILSKYGK